MSEIDKMSENPMGTEKLSWLVLKTGLPMMFSLLLNSLYNFVDSVFVSRLSEDALTAVSLAAPVQLLMSSFGLGIAVGLNAVISKALGAKDHDKVKRAASAAIWLALAAWLLIVLLCLLFLKPYFQWQSSGDAVIAGLGQDYLRICMLFSFVQMLQWVFDRFVMASGKSHLFLFTLSAASVTNLILDPILIFGLFGFPAMGIEGAAAATVIGQCFGAVAGIVINIKFNREIPVAFRIKPDWGCVAEILRIGLPSSVVQIITSVAGVVVNSILIGFSTSAVAVYGICLRLQGVVTVGTHGINNGVIPIVAYNYGAKKPERIHGTGRFAYLYGVILYLPFLAVLEFLPQWVLALFKAESNLLNIGIPALRIMGFGYFLSILCLVIAAVLQGLGMSLRSMLLTLLRQVVVPILFILVFRFAINARSIWWMFVLAELMVMPAGYFIYRKTVRGIGG